MFVIVFFLLISKLSAHQWCEQYFHKTETKFNVPQHLLHAIALTESGQSLSKKGMIAWPWTINVQGKGYLFSSKQKVIIAARFMLQLGYNNFDVGCMQINLKHHPKAFSSLEAAFDPQTNISYAAKFLSNLYHQHKDWETAVGFYHNTKEVFYKPYKKKVARHLKHLINDETYAYKDEKDLSLVSLSLQNVFTHADHVFFPHIKQKISEKQTQERTNEMTPISVAAKQIAGPQDRKHVHAFERLNAQSIHDHSEASKKSFNKVYKLPNGALAQGNTAVPMNMMHIKNTRYNIGNKNDPIAQNDYKKRVTIIK